MITIANTITIAVAIFPISPRPNADTHTHNQWQADTRFRWKIWVGNLLSPRSNCLPFLWNLRLQLSTPWVWGILRYCHGGCTKDKVQTMISTDVMISATIHCPPCATHHTPHASHLPVPGLYNSASLRIEHAGAYMEPESSEIASVFPLASVLASHLKVYLCYGGS